SQLLRNSITPNIVAAYETGATGLIAAGPLIAFGPTEGAVGYVAPDVTAGIVDAAGKTLAHGQQGIIRVRSSHQATVHAADGASAPPSPADGWLYPGDTGSLTPDGTLIVHDRA